MTTKAKSRAHRRPVGKKPAAARRRGAGRVPKGRLTRPSAARALVERPQAETIGGTNGPLIDEGSWGQ